MSNSKQFYKFVITSIGAMVVTGLYVVVDGIFVGRGVGSNGLAAVNLAIPFVSILTSVTMMITMGGATLTSICFGKGENPKANNYFNFSMWIVMLFALSLTIISVLFSYQIAKALGASDILLQGTADYIKYYVMFGIFFAGSMALAVFVRNDGNPKLAFWGMIVGAVSNVFLDWLFIFPLQLGVVGAAVASGLGQVLACLTLSLHFIKKKGVLKIAKPIRQKRIIKEISSVGFPEFITQMSQAVTILAYNTVVLHFYGEIGISAFSVISYILVIVVAVFIGLAQGIQPLISQSYGENNETKQNYFFKKGLQLNLTLSVVVYIMMFIFGKNIISIFSSDQALIEIAYECIKVYGLSFLFASVNIVYTTYFLATKKTKKAIFIAVCRSFIFNSIFIFVMPLLFGKDFIWSGMIVAELVVMIIVILSSINNNKKTNTASLS